MRPSFIVAARGGLMRLRNEKLTLRLFFFSLSCFSCMFRFFFHHLVPPNFPALRLPPGEIMRGVLFAVRRRVRRHHRDDDRGAHEPAADAARVRVQRSRPFVYLFHRFVRRPNAVCCSATSRRCRPPVHRRSRSRSRYTQPFLCLLHLILSRERHLFAILGASCAKESFGGRKVRK